MIIRTASADVAVANGSLAVRDSNGTVPVTTQKYAKDVLVTGAMALQDIMNMKTIYVSQIPARNSVVLWRGHCRTNTRLACRHALTH